MKHSPTGKSPNLQSSSLQPVSLQSPRKPAALSAAVRDSLNRYALAAGATGVALLAPQSARAEVVFTPAHEVILTHHKITLDLNHDGIGDFAISNKSFCTDICGRTLRATALVAGNKIEGMKSIFILEFASALKRGAQIGPSADFAGKLMWVSGTEYGYGGNWDNVTDRYLGLKFSIGGATHYGWARFSVAVANQTVTATLTGYAYETVANRPITAGKVKGPAEISAPAELTLALPGLLAMGAPGLGLWRSGDR